MELTKEMKILLLKILKSGKLSQKDADVLINFMEVSGIFERIQIVFKNFNEDER